MQLDIAKALQSPGEEIPFACSEQLPPTQWDGEEVQFLSPLEVRGTFKALKELVWVHANVNTRMRLACANCLGEAHHDGKATMEACFSRTPAPDNPDLFAFDGHTLQLDDAALGALWLEMPMRILCSPDCLGLCPVCGTDRNKSTCSCQKELQSKHPFSALATLLNQDEEV